MSPYLSGFYPNFTQMWSAIGQRFAQLPAIVKACILIKTVNKLLDFHIDQYKVLTIINSLSASKSSGPDEISVRMLKLCPTKMHLYLNLSSIKYFIPEPTHARGNWLMYNLCIKRAAGS